MDWGNEKIVDRILTRNIDFSSVDNADIICATVHCTKRMKFLETNYSLILKCTHIGWRLGNITKECLHRKKKLSHSIPLECAQ